MHITCISFRSSCLLKKMHIITSLSLLYIFAVDANHNNEGKVMCFKYFDVLGADTVWDVTPHSFVGMRQHFESFCCLFLHSRGSPSVRPSRCHDIALNYTVATNIDLLTNRQSVKNAKWRWLICGFLTQVMTLQNEHRIG